MTATWLPGNALAFDTETTGSDPLTARIVSATCVEVGAAGVVRRETWLVNPGVPIPPEATAIHGITDLMAAGGLHPLEAVPAIISNLKDAWRRGLPVVIMSANYDLTVLTQEAVRIAHEGFEVGSVIDPLVIDRAVDPYRKGSRKLVALAEHYGVRLDGAHSSDGDALGVARVVWRMAKTVGPLSKMTLAELQKWQADAHFKWAVNFADYLRGKDPTKEPSISADWPMRITKESTNAIAKRTA